MCGSVELQDRPFETKCILHSVTKIGPLQEVRESNEKVIGQVQSINRTLNALVGLHIFMRVIDRWSNGTSKYQQVSAALEERSRRILGLSCPSNYSLSIVEVLYYSSLFATAVSKVANRLELRCRVQVFRSFSKDIGIDCLSLGTCGSRCTLAEGKTQHSVFAAGRCFLTDVLRG